MLATEFGGMNEVLADLYADTGNRRWLALSDHFDHRAVIDPLSRREDILAGKHGNTLVPKLLGALVQYEYTGSERDGTAAKFFWDEVALHHSFATGGHGRNEYFGEPDKLNDMIEGRTAETCNVYNLIKMARALFALEPDIRYADFQERALFNHILGSIDPADGAMCYMVPVGQGVSREYQNMTQQLHLLRRLGHGEPRAPRRRHLLRGSGPALGESLRAVGGPVADGRRHDHDRDDVPRRRCGVLTVTLKAPKTLHARAAAAVLGRALASR